MLVFERVTALCRVLERGRLGFGNRAIGLGVHLSVWVYMQAYVRVFTHVAGRSFCQLHTCACLTMRISRHCTFLSNSHCCCSSSSSPRTAANATATSTSTSTTTSTSTSPSTSATSIITTTTPPPPPLAAAPEAAAAATTQLLTIPPLRVTHPASAATVAAAVLTSVSIRRSTRSTHCHHQRRKVNSVHGASTVGASSWIATLFFAAIL